MRAKLKQRGTTIYNFYRTESSKDNNKGVFLDSAALLAAHPTGKDGWYASVTSTGTTWTWDSTAGQWIDTAVTSGVQSVNGQIGDVVLDADDVSDASTVNKFATQAELDKLAGIEAGAQVNDVDSVNGATGAVVLDYADVGAVSATGQTGDFTVGTTDNQQVTLVANNKTAAVIDDGYILFRPSGDYGWRDLMAPIDPRSGVSAPTWTVFRNGIYLYAFPSNQVREAFASFHIDHDYALGTPLYPHIHFTVNTTSSGTVRWGFEWTFAKGHGLEAFPATQTIYLEQAINGATDQYRHFALETPDLQAIPGTGIDTDGIILLRIFRDAAHPNDTYPDDAFGIQVDMHYKSDRYSTKNKSPDFR